MKPSEYEKIERTLGSCVLNIDNDKDYPGSHIYILRLKSLFFHLTNAMGFD